MESITLLNGHQIAKDEILKKMEDDSYYYGYLGKHAFSSSRLKPLLDSPKIFWKETQYGSKDTSALAIGRAIHIKALEAHRYDDIYEIVETSSKNTKIWKEAVASTEKTCLTSSENNTVNRVVDALLRNTAFITRLNGSTPEVPAIGYIGGFPFRAKADILKQEKIFDLKTTSGIKAFPISAQKYNYDLQAYIYCTLFNVDWWNFEFIVVDKSTLEIAVYNVSEEFFNSGKAKCEQALEIYRNFFHEQDENTILSNLDNLTFYGTL